MTTTVTTPRDDHRGHDLDDRDARPSRASETRPGGHRRRRARGEITLFSLDHTRASIDALCRAIAPFAPTWRWVRDGFDGTGSIARAIAVRAGMVALVTDRISSSRPCA